MLADRLRAAASSAELDQSDVADLVGADRRTVARWLASEVEPRQETRRRLLEIVAVLERLSAVFRPQDAHDWLFTPNPMLDNHRPVDLIGGRSAEGTRQVLGTIDAIGEGVFV